MLAGSQFLVVSFQRHNLTAGASWKCGGVSPEVCREASRYHTSHAAVRAGIKEPCHPDRQGAKPAPVDQVCHPPPGGAKATPPQTAQHAWCMLLLTCRHRCQLLRLMLRGAGCRGGWLGECRRAVPVPRLKPRCWHMLDSSPSVLSCEHGTAQVYSVQAVSGRHPCCVGS
jgi:hypothetical protein